MINNHLSARLKGIEFDIKLLRPSQKCTDYVVLGIEFDFFFAAHWPRPILAGSRRANLTKRSTDATTTLLQVMTGTRQISTRRSFGGRGERGED